MPITPLDVQRLARQLNWGLDDARLCLESVTHESDGMSVEGASQVILVLNRSVAEMSEGMAAVIVLAAAYRAGVSSDVPTHPDRNGETAVCG